MLKILNQKLTKNMAIIIKKIRPEYFDSIIAGEKKFELRLNDFEVKAGDTLRLEEFDQGKYTGRSLEKLVSHVQKFKIDELFWPPEEILEKGFTFMSLE